MNDIRQYNRDLSVKQRAGSMTALDRIRTAECYRNFINTMNNLNMNVPPHLMMLNIIYAVFNLLFVDITLIPRKITKIPLLRTHRRIRSEYEFREIFNSNKWNAPRVKIACIVLYVVQDMIDIDNRLTPPINE